MHASDMSLGFFTLYVNVTFCHDPIICIASSYFWLNFNFHYLIHFLVLNFLFSKLFSLSLNTTFFEPMYLMMAMENAIYGDEDYNVDVLKKDYNIAMKLKPYIS